MSEGVTVSRELRVRVLRERVLRVRVLLVRGSYGFEGVRGAKQLRVRRS